MTLALVHSKPPAPAATLKEATARIHQLVQSADTNLLDAAVELAAVRARFEAGEFKPTTWPTWVRTELHIGESRARELLRVGQAADPAAELARLREANAERQARHRARAKSAAAPPRMAREEETPSRNAAGEAAREALSPADELIAWTRRASDADISRVLDFALKLAA